MTTKDDNNDHLEFTSMLQMRMKNCTTTCSKTEVFFKRNPVILLVNILRARLAFNQVSLLP